MDRKPKNYWTYDRCCEEALKYKTRTEFQENSSGSYYNSMIMGWLDKICLHMNKPDIYTKDYCQLEALKYSTRTFFCKYSNIAYRRSLKNNWLDDICKHMTTLYWTYTECEEEALKYTNVEQFRSENRTVLNKINKKGWFELISHLTTDRIPKDRLIYVYEFFNEKSVYVGLTGNPCKRDYDHKNYGRLASYMNSCEYSYKMLTDFVSEQKAQELENYYKEYYMNLGWDILNIAKTGSLGGSKLKWTYEKCKDEALKYTNYKQFKESSICCYRRAKINNWLDQICSHFIEEVKCVKPEKIKQKWQKLTYDICKTEALKYNNIHDFQKMGGGAYSKALKMSWLDEITSHMKKRKRAGYWNFENCQIEALKYKTRHSFEKGCCGAYKASIKNNWLDLICEHMKYVYNYKN